MTAREDIISVAATDPNDVRASFSSYGTWVDISAPGEDIMSLYHVHDDASSDYVASASGTSMAAPLAAGVAAIIWSQNPSWSTPRSPILIRLTRLPPSVSTSRRIHACEWKSTTSWDGA